MIRFNTSIRQNKFKFNYFEFTLLLSFLAFSPMFGGHCLVA